jgi:hypothetical protein
MWATERFVSKFSYLLSPSVVYLKQNKHNYIMHDGLHELRVVSL